MGAAELERRRTFHSVRMACTLISLAAALLAVRALGAHAPVRVGEPAPALIVPRLDGAVFDLAALRGKVVIINFWATWCSPCRAEMPQLDAFYRRYRARGLELLGVSVDDAQDRDAVVRVMKSFNYPAALAAAAKVNDFGAPIAVPMTWIIDAKGIVRARLVTGNAATMQSLEQAVLPLLPQAAATHAP
jgi:cytochrome c biogenesis protein CcmG, thiol:disulfide interchange protein DsbE